MMQHFREARVARIAMAAASAAVVFSPLARAADTTWSSPASGWWSHATYWSTHAVPTAADAVFIDAAGGPYTVKFDTRAASSGPLTLDAADATLALDGVSTFQTGDALLAGGTLSVTDYVPITWTVGTGGTGTLTNNGTMAFAASGGYVGYPTNDVRAASFVNAGTVDLRYVGSYVHAHPFEFVVPAVTNTGVIRTVESPYGIRFVGTTFEQDGGSIDGTLSFVGSTFNYNGGSVSAASRIILSSSTANIAPDAGPVPLAFTTGGNTLNGPIGTGSVVRLFPEPNTGDASLTVNAPANDGHIIVGYQPPAGSMMVAYNKSTLTLAAAAFTNNGTIDLNTASSYGSIVNGDVVNNGTVNVARPYDYASISDATTLNGNWTNNGTFNVADLASAHLAPGCNFTQNAGTLFTTTHAYLAIEDAHFDFNGGTIDGGVMLRDSSLHIGPGAGSGYFVLSATAGPIPVDGDVPAGSTITFVSDIGGGGAFSGKAAARSFSNLGTFECGTGIIGLYLHADDDPGQPGTLTNAGTIEGSPSSTTGALLSVHGNLTNAGTVRARLVTVSGTLDQNAGSIDVAGSLVVTSGGVFNYNGGAVTGKPVTLYDASLNLAPGVGPAAFVFAGNTGSLHGDVSPGSSVALSASDGESLAVTASPFTNGGAITIGDRSALLVTGPFANHGTVSLASATSALLIDYGGVSPADAVRFDILAGHLRGALPGVSVAYAEASQLPPDRVAVLAGGLPTDADTLIVTLTSAGDANLDGIVNADDYVLLDRTLAKHIANPHWTDGDFNHDGVVDQKDYLLIDTNVGQARGFGAGFLARRESQFGAAYVSALLAAVPEPTALACLLAGSVPLLARRRRARP